MREHLYICKACDITFMAYDSSCPMCKLQREVDDLQAALTNTTVERDSDHAESRITIAELERVLEKCVCQTLAGEK